MDRSHSVDGLVAAHLAHHGEDRIDLRAFRYMLEEGRIVLLFDGFDELVTRLSYDRAADHLENLLEAARGKAKVVVAARTQHFRTDEQVFTALGRHVALIPHRRVLAVEDFTAAQIHAYFVNRHGGDEEAANARFRLLTGINDLLELAQNPRMLGFVADLDMERVAAAVAHRHTISPAGLYQEILDSWMAHESRRASGGPGAAPGLDTTALWGAVTTLAMALWEADETWLRPAQLVEVADTLTGLTAETLSQQQRVHAVGSGSLLVRTEEGLFGFIHPSVTEWLVAKAIAAEFNAGIAAPAALVRQPPAPAGRRLPVRHRRHEGGARLGRRRPRPRERERAPRRQRACGARPARRPRHLGHARRLAARRRPVLPRPGGSRPHRRRPHRREPRGGEPDRRRAARRRAGRRPAGPGPARQQPTCRAPTSPAPACVAPT